ncbi:DMT family transporter [Filifactor alocis]|uniref:DMT family transporter n=1 Tax=Filifactor alocis TaxID=143361 RepID=UPI0028E8173C|nr:DMT family transporter [Filifactor alocis]
MQPKDNQKVLALMLLLFTCVAWGGSYVSIQICLGAMGPVYLPFFRYLLSAVLLFVVLKAKGTSLKLEKSDWMKVTLTALFSITVYFYFENSAIKQIGANEAAILVAMLPVVALIGNRIFLKQKLLPRNIISAVISIVGIYFVIGGVQFGENKVGYFYVFLSNLSWSAYLINTKPLLKKYEGLVLTFYQCLIGSLAFVPALPTDYFYFDKIDIGIILHFLFLALVCSAVCTVCYTFAIKHCGVGISALCLNFIPVATFFFSFLILREVMRPIQLIGAFVAISGLMLMKEDQAIDG